MGSWKSGFFLVASFLNFVIGAVILRWVVKQRIKYHGLFPPLDMNGVKFRQRTASGNSQRNLLTKLGGARRALEVVVVDDELWIRAPFPLSILFTGAEFDLAHRVQLKDIHLVEAVTRFDMGEGLRLIFDDWWGDKKIVELWVNDGNSFRQAIRK